MITIYKTEKVEKEQDGYAMSVELRGLSTDNKPTVIGNSKVQNGSAFIEIDTGKVYLYDLATETWKEI